MKIKHKNEDNWRVYDAPLIEKINGIYGLLIIDINRKVWIIYDDSIEYDDVTNQYIIED